MPLQLLPKTIDNYASISLSMLNKIGIGKEMEDNEAEQEEEGK